MSGPERTLARLLEGLVPADALPDVDVSGLALDSRLVRAGDGFVALAGASGHGMAFVDQAAAAGATVVIHDGREQVPADCSLPAVAVPRLDQHLARLAGRMWSDPARTMDLVAVTGTNGKSSVAWLLAQALDGAMIGTLGIGRPGTQRRANLTTPDLFSLYRSLAELREQGVVRVVMEASSHALDQGRLAGLDFSSVIFTTLGHDHLDYHADREAYKAAKARLFTDYCSARQLINLDDEFGQALAERLESSGGLVGYSLAGHPRARAHARLLQCATSGLAAEIEIDRRRLSVHAPLVGRIHLWNLLIVAVELAERGHSDQAIVDALATLEPVPGRMQPVPSDDGRLAIIDYAHTPDALVNALDSAREVTRHELWCVFGCGGDRDRSKRPRMGRIAESLADHIVLTDDNPRHEDGLAIIRDIQSGMERPERCLVIRDRALAIERAINRSGTGDVVLIAGKGHESEQIVGHERLPFDDVLCARQALERAA